MFRDPFDVFDEIRGTYLRYLNSPFKMRYPSLMRERSRLMDRDGALYRDPRFEVIKAYKDSGMSASAA